MSVSIDVFPRIDDPTIKNLSSIEAVKNGILGRGKDGEYLKEWIPKIRKAYKQHLNNKQDKEYWEMRRNHLPLFTPSGYWPEGIKRPGIHSGLVILDFDKVWDAHEVRNEMNRIPYTVFSFVSPSGEGVKTIVKVSPRPRTWDEHKAAWFQVRDLYRDTFNETVDRSGSNWNRLCYYSYDPSLVEGDGEPFELGPGIIPEEPVIERSDTYKHEIRHFTHGHWQAYWQKIIRAWEEELANAQPSMRHHTLVRAALVLFKTVGPYNSEDEWKYQIHHLAQLITRPLEPGELQGILDWAKRSEGGQRKHWSVFPQEHD